MTRTRTGLALGVLLAPTLAVAACGGDGGGKSDGVASLGGADQSTSTTVGGSQDERQGGAHLGQVHASARH
jgi:hypothetical protein